MSAFPMDAYLFTHISFVRLYNNSKKFLISRGYKKEFLVHSHSGTIQEQGKPQGTGTYDVGKIKYYKSYISALKSHCLIMQCQVCKKIKLNMM